MKDSFYNSENIIKIVAYDELTASEFPAITTSTYSLTNDIVQKVYKFYINKNGYDRLRTGDKFYIKGLDINNQSKKDVINFFDKKFKIGSWTDYTEENFGVTNTGKKGYEYSAFLSTPLENSYKIKTATFSYSGIKYYTTIDGLNQTLVDRMTAMAEAFKEQTGKKIFVTSGYRSNEEQKELYDRWVQGGKKDKIVSKPKAPLKIDPKTDTKTQEKKISKLIIKIQFFIISLF